MTFQQRVPWHCACRRWPCRMPGGDERCRSVSVTSAFREGHRRLHDSRPSFQTRCSFHTPATKPTLLSQTGGLQAATTALHHTHLSWTFEPTAHRVPLPQGVIVGGVDSPEHRTCPGGHAQRYSSPRSHLLSRTNVTASPDFSSQILPMPLPRTLSCVGGHWHPQCHGVTRSGARFSLTDVPSDVTELDLAVGG
jgi:hypothetical protein